MRFRFYFFILITSLLSISSSDLFDKAKNAFQSLINSLPEITIGSYSRLNSSGTTINAIATDSDKDELTYTWSETTNYGVVFSDKNSLETEITFGKEQSKNADVVINAGIRLTVSDGEDEVYKDSVIKIYRSDILYFSETGSDTSNGYYPDSPRGGDINSAITKAVTSSKVGVAFAGGTYNVEYDAG